MKTPIRRITTSLLVFAAGVTLCTKSPEPSIDIHYLGHSSFILRFDERTTVVTDHGHENAWVEWGWDSPIRSMGTLVPNIMTFSHEHEDHYDSDRIPEDVGDVLTDGDSLTFDGIAITPIRTCEIDIHTESNTSYLFEFRDRRILHLGDAQAQIMAVENPEVRRHIQTVLPESLDLLFIPIQGTDEFIPQAETFIDLLRPRRVIIMHYWSEAYREAFLDHMREQRDAGKSYSIRALDAAQITLSLDGEAHGIEIISLNCGPFVSFDQNE